MLVLASLTLACSEESTRDRARTEDGAFDAGEALALLQRQVAFGPRVPNTAAHHATREFLREHLAARAGTVALEEFQHVTAQGDTLRLTNLIASFNPAAGRRVLLAAHWDTRPVAERDPDPERRPHPIPGANDGASGVAVLLSVADVLFRNPLPLEVGVDVVLLDGEDYGHHPVTLRTRTEDMFLGAREFARRHADYRPVLGILLDLVGDRDPLFRQEGYSLEFAAEHADLVWQTARDLGLGDVFQACRLGRITDDHLFLNQAGIRTIAIIDLDYPAWHTQADDPSNVSLRTLGMVGDVVLEVLYRRLSRIPTDGPPTSFAASVPADRRGGADEADAIPHGSPLAVSPPCK